jgi:hypothetical protein|tara:strand:- start:8760 stop:8870 length:111 start_codon:yes stop_codon:yes gene_type:complete
MGLKKFLPGESSDIPVYHMAAYMSGNTTDSKVFQQD